MLLKSLFDHIVAFLGLLFLSPILLVTAILIRVKMPGGPVIFKQKRVGQYGRLFTMYKFRSMTVGHSGSSVSVKGESRITPLGAKLRKYKIDELPELWNVLIGDMSLVGTRPPTIDEFEQYKGYHKQRLSMTPGLTGVWQVSGRNDIKDFEEIVAMDVDYINNWSLKRDIEIILQTIRVVLTSSGAR